MNVRCSTLVSFVLVCFVAIPHATWSSPQPPATAEATAARRCLSGWNNHAIALMDDLAQSSCHSCDLSQYSHLDIKPKEDGPDVGIVLPHHESLLEPYLTIATALLMGGHRVTLFTNKWHTDLSASSDLRDFIQSRVPCNLRLSVSNLLRIEFMVMKTYPCYNDEIDKSARIRCAIREMDEFLLSRFRTTFRAYPVDILILDAAMIAGQLAAQSLGIPVVALLDPDFNDDLLVRRWVHSRPQTLWSKGIQKFTNFWEEMEWAGTFTRYNRASGRLALPVPATVGGMWDSITLVVTKPRHVKSKRVYVVEGPLLTPCLPCFEPSPNHEYPTYRYRAVLNLKSYDNNERMTRGMYKAFWMARDSLNRWSSHCKVRNCPQNVTEWHDFGVAHIGSPRDTFVPRFVVPFSDEIFFLAALGYFISNKETLVLVVVDKKALYDRPWLTELDPSIVSVSPGSTVRELTMEIIKGIHQIQKPTKRLRTNKGIDPVLKALRRKSPLTEGSHEDNNHAARVVSVWLGLCFLVAFSTTFLELCREGGDRERMIEILWRQFGWSELEATMQEWMTWARLEWHGRDTSPTTQTMPNSNIPHRRRRGHKKKQT